MTMTLDEFVEQCPVPCFVSNGEQLHTFNVAAAASFSLPEAVFAVCFAAAQIETRDEGDFKVQYEEAWLTVSRLKGDDATYFFVIADQTDQELTRALDRAKKPQKQLIQTLQNMVSTAKGYAELIAVMLEENQMVAGERLAAVRRYEQYVNDHLLDMEALLEQALDRQFLLQAAFDDQIDVSVLICLSNPVRGELVAELFKSQGVTTRLAATPEEAAKLLVTHSESTRLLVLDSPIADIAAWQDRNADAALIACCESGLEALVDQFGERGCQLSDQPLDINHLLKAAIELLNQ